VLPGPARLLAGAGYLAIVLVDGVIQILLTGVGARRVERRLAKRAPAVVAPPAVVTDIVSRAGVRRFALRVSTGRLIQDRAYRLGRSASIVLSAVTIVESASLPFVLAHEIGHVVRRDSGHHRASFIMAASMVVIPLAAPAPLPLVIAVVAGAVVFVADRWRAEYACDAFAVRWVGAEPLRLWMTTYAGRLSRPENRTPRRRLRRSLGRLTHPPIDRRMARAETLTRALGHGSADGSFSRRSRPGRTQGRRRIPWPRRSPATPADPDAGSSRTRRASG
jgi:Zn-dependent protease with chaperone function